MGLLLQEFLLLFQSLQPLLQDLLLFQGSSNGEHQQLNNISSILEYNPNNTLCRELQFLKDLLSKFKSQKKQ